MSPPESSAGCDLMLTSGCCEPACGWPWMRPRVGMTGDSLPSTQVRMFDCTRPTDMRKSFDGLSGLVADVFQAELLSG